MGQEPPYNNKRPDPNHSWKGSVRGLSHRSIRLLLFRPRATSEQTFENEILQRGTKRCRIYRSSVTPPALLPPLSISLPLSPFPLPQRPYARRPSTNPCAKPLTLKTPPPPPTPLTPSQQPNRSNYNNTCCLVSVRRRERRTAWNISTSPPRAASMTIVSCSLTSLARKADSCLPASISPIPPTIAPTALGSPL